MLWWIIWISKKINHFYYWNVECIEYQNAVYETTYTSVGLNARPVEEKIFRCSISTVPLIVGGEKARPKEFPHMVIW